MWCPPGIYKEWSSDPFVPTITDDGHLRGRGAADMKSSLAAMVVAVEDFLNTHPKPSGRISFLLTSDEEGPATQGTVAVVELLKERQQASNTPAIDYCIVGEPSSKETLGDVVRVGRRGSLNALITVQGTQGHVAYPELVDNPIHRHLISSANWLRPIGMERPMTLSHQQAFRSPTLTLEPGQPMWSLRLLHSDVTGAFRPQPQAT